MKKVLIVAGTLLVVATALNAAPILFEAYQEGTVSIPADETDTVTIVEIIFSVDTTCFVQFSAGGFTAHTFIWLTMDGDNLPALTRMGHNTVPQGFSLPYAYILDAGNHTVKLTMTIWGNYAAICSDAYLQALIFLPDAGGAIAERPDGDADVTSEITSVISRGPYVTVTGATELVDATGRVIENAIEDDRVSINNLSQGTYFARKEGKTLVKIVKVD